MKVKVEYTKKCMQICMIFLERYKFNNKFGIYLFESGNATVVALEPNR